jgi:hypothetical protein
MEKSANISNLTKALAQFHALVGKIGKDAKNPFFKSNYASLPHILTEVSDPLQQAGLVITQFPDGDALTTMLIHAESGEYIASSYTMPVAKANDPQALGSAISYARRYSVSSILSLKIDDDDAEGAMKAVRQPEDSRSWLNKGEALNKAMEYLRSGGTIAEIEKKYRLSSEIKKSLELIVNNLKP